ncbi:uncharacterized protein UV8b_07910 [Ustilaginoidea virens]|uniref:Uncharacterized protein n=1 Tax=Ustilaginoidea virens TaxID=1159556 RepID=A0A8E5HYR9_USTVR|nr:uncharacterized protein UV8b_07910 [Ustilaginoidea virens]QUC23669.1 hypothetical protein UV8b_07910 [Ustilaginoidea virens]
MPSYPFNHESQIRVSRSSRPTYKIVPWDPDFGVSRVSRGNKQADGKITMDKTLRVEELSNGLRDIFGFAPSLEKNP